MILLTNASIVLAFITLFIITVSTLIINNKRAKKIKEIESRFKKPINFKVEEKKI